MFFELFDEDTAGWRPAPLPEVAGPQARVLQRTVEPIVDAVPLVPLLDDPVPQTVEQLQDVLQFFDRLSTVPEPVIEVPKIFTEDVPYARGLAYYAAGRTAGGSADDLSMSSLLHALLEYTGSGLWSRTLTFQLWVAVELVEVFPVFSQDRIVP